MYSRPAESLPPYRALLVVDIRDFSGRLGRDHSALTEIIPFVLSAAFNRCGLGSLWNDHRFGQGTGDGYVAGFESQYLPFLLNPFLSALQEELAERNKIGWPESPGQPVQMRVSVNVGPMTDEVADKLGEGSGSARIESHRILDCGPVRQLIARAGRTTCVAAAVGSHAYTDAVLSGYSGEEPDIYVRVPVIVKSYDGIAYLRVPTPSGDLLTEGFLPPATDEKPKEKTKKKSKEIEGRTSTKITTAHGPVHTGRGDQNFGHPAKNDNSKRER